MRGCQGDASRASWVRARLAAGSERDWQRWRWVPAGCLGPSAGWVANISRRFRVWSPSSGFRIRSSHTGTATSQLAASTGRQLAWIGTMLALRQMEMPVSPPVKEMAFTPGCMIR